MDFKNKEFRFKMLKTLSIKEIKNLIELNGIIVISDKI